MKITGKKALKMLERIVEERGENYLYDMPDSGCAYQVGGVPSCGIGLALSKFGAPADTLRKLDGEMNLDGKTYEYSSGSSSINTGRSRSVLDYEGFILTPKARLVFMTFQGMQDTSRTWGEALDAAKRIHRSGKTQP